MAKRGTTFNHYTSEFKMSVVNAYLSGQSGYDSIAKQFGVASGTQVRIWVKQYRTNPNLSAFEDQRKVNGSNNPNFGKHLRKKGITDLSLEEQVEYLKMENAILKRLSALSSKK